MRKKNNSNMPFIGGLLIIIVGLVYYIINKPRLDYKANEALSNETTEAVKDYYKNGWDDIKAVFNGDKKFFG